MAITEVVYKKTTVGSLVTGVLEFDTSVSETHVDEAEITSHPVELGGEVSDHIRKLPESLTINGIVTDTPLELPPKSPVQGDFVPTTDRVGTAYSLLQEIMEAGQTVDVATSLRDYSSMAIQSLSVLRDSANGNVLNCTVSLKEIILARTLAVDLPAPIDAANKAAQNKGKKNTTPPTPPQEENTSGIYDFLSSVFA